MDPLKKNNRGTIRFYEKQGLIKVKRNDRRANNYKEYSSDNLKRLLTIKVIKGFGFTLNETSELLELIESNQASCDNIAEKAAEKVKLIEAKIAELNALKELLNESVASCLTCCETTSIEQNCKLLDVV